MRYRAEMRAGKSTVGRPHACVGHRIGVVEHDMALEAGDSLRSEDQAGRVAPLA